HHGLQLGMWAGDRIFVGHLAETADLPRLARMRPGRDPGPGASLVDFLTVQVETLLRALAPVEERARAREVGRAVPLPDGGSRYVLLGGRVPQEHLLGRLGEILTLHDLERQPMYCPAGHEGALRAVGTGNADGGRELVVHQEREGAAVAAVSAQTVGDADHPVAADRVTDAQ